MADSAEPALVATRDPVSRVAEALARMGVGHERRVDVAQPPFAMPMHAALDGDCFRVDRLEGGALFAKAYHHDIPFAPDFEAAGLAAKRAGELGLAPAWRAGFADLRVHLFDWAPDGFRMAMRPDFDRADVRANSLAALRRHHSGPPLARSWDPFLALGAYRSAFEDAVHAERARNVRLPPDWGALLAAAETIARAVASAGVDQRPIRNETLISNFLVGPRDEVLMVDFDRAADADPFYDLAALCSEFCVDEDDLAQALEIYAGRADAAKLNRVRLYMYVDDLLWGLWAKLAHVHSPHSGRIEFYKYGEVRWIRARYRLEAWDVEALRRSL